MGIGYRETIVHAANLSAIEQALQHVYNGYYFIYSDGNMHGLCTGMKVRLGEKSLANPRRLKAVVIEEV